MIKNDVYVKKTYIYYICACFTVSSCVSLTTYWTRYCLLRLKCLDSGGAGAKNVVGYHGAFGACRAIFLILVACTQGELMTSWLGRYFQLVGCTPTEIIPWEIPKKKPYIIGLYGLSLSRISRTYNNINTMGTHPIVPWQMELEGLNAGVYIIWYWNL